MNILNLAGSLIGNISGLVANNPIASVTASAFIGVFFWKIIKQLYLIIKPLDKIGDFFKTKAYGAGFKYGTILRLKIKDVELLKRAVMDSESVTTKVEQEFDRGMFEGARIIK